MVKQISDNEIYLLIKYMKSVLWKVVKRLSYIEDARCLKVNQNMYYALLNITKILLLDGRLRLKCDGTRAETSSSFGETDESI